MKEVFIKRYWGEENTTFYLHFVDEIAAWQIEISPKRNDISFNDHPIEKESASYDQSLDDLALGSDDFISNEDSIMHGMTHRERFRNIQTNTL